MNTLEQMREAAWRLNALAKSKDRPAEVRLSMFIAGNDRTTIFIADEFYFNRECVAYVMLQKDAEGKINTCFNKPFKVDNLITGYSEELETYIRERMAETRAFYKRDQERREREAREAATEAERIRFHGYTDGMTPMQKGRVIKCLSKRYHYDDSGIMTRAEHVEKNVKSGHLSTWINPQGKTEYRMHGSGSGFYVVTKTEYEYFKFLGASNIPF